MTDLPEPENLACLAPGGRAIIPPQNVTIEVKYLDNGIVQIYAVEDSDDN
jgi:hypothetical protein